MSTKRPPMVVLHVWEKDKKRGPGVYHCMFCGSVTANFPLYRYEICPKADRRVANTERRAEADRPS